jgi:alkylation response protein AidB-like acyl-CoA dehydrogenase
MSSKLYKGGEYLVSEGVCADVFTPEDFSDEQRAIAETTEQFVENEIMPNIEEIDKQNFDLTVECLQKAGELGLLMMDAPEDFGGLELDKVTSMLVAEKVGPAGSFGATYICHTGIGTLPLIYFGNDDQKERYLEKIITGEWPAAYCLTEPGAGSDALNAATTAILSEDGSHYVLNGTKQFITNGGFAELFTVFAKVDKEHFTGFLLERSFEGLSIGPEEKKLGIKGTSTTQVILDNVKVPVENVLGEVGKGHKIAFNVLNIGRFKLGPFVSGMAKYTLNEAIKYSIDRKQFNTPICRFGAIQEKIANASADIFATDSMVYRLAGQIDDRLATLDKESDDYYSEYLQGIEEYAAECAIIKFYSTEVLREVADESLQIFGGYGFTSEYPAERILRDERIQRLYEGTNEINRILTPGIFLRKAGKGELPLQEAGAEAFKKLDAATEPVCDGAFAKELALLNDLKTLWLSVTGAGVQKFGAKVGNEQEFLMASADVAAQIYALESSVLRAEKISASLSASKQEILAAVIKICAFRANENISTAARKGAFYAAEGGVLKTLLGGIKTLCDYDAVGLLQAQRTLADASIESEKYIF